MRTLFTAAVLMMSGLAAPAIAQHLPPVGGPFPPPFTATLSNNTPLAFGMDEETAARALGSQLNYVSGRPGEEIYLTFRNVGGSGLFYKKDRSTCNSARAGSPDGRATGAITGCGSRISFPKFRDLLRATQTQMDEPWEKISS